MKDQNKINKKIKNYKSKQKNIQKNKRNLIKKGMKLKQIRISKSKNYNKKFRKLKT